MNQAQTKRIEKLILRLEALCNEIEAEQSEFESIVEEMQDKFDSRSERWQESDKGTEASECLDHFHSVCDGLREIADLCGTVGESLRDGMAIA